MRKVLFFMFTTLNGYYTRGRDAHDWSDIDWHNFDDQMSALSLEQIESVDTILFGRATYEGMASYWPTEAASADNPVITAKMNSLPKVVFSNSLPKADWSNTRLVRGDAADEVAKLKAQPGGDMIIYGSSDMAASLAARGLIDEYRIMVNPILLTAGKPVFKGLERDVPLKLLAAKPFSNGNVLLTYAPAPES